MRILAVDTSSAVASCAIVDGEKLVCEEILNNGLTHSQTIMPMIESVMKRSGLETKDIDLFAAVTGPGSFTGLRIGVSAVKALAHAADKPCVAVSTLEAMAYNLPFCEKLIVPIMDARRGEVYNGIYRFGGGELSVIREDRALSIEELCEDVNTLDCDAVFLGDGLPVFREKIKEMLGDKAYFAPANLNAQMAASAALVAQKKEQINYSKLAPVYLRKSQAEREREERGE